jgi:hypothetical protein
VNLVIVVPLQSTDWKPPFNDGGKGEWRCRALALPTARFRCLRRPDDTIVPEESYKVRGTRITWKGGGRPQDGLRVEISLARRLHSTVALLLALILGAAAGVYFAPNLDLGQVQALIDGHLAQVWAVLG